MGLALPSKDDIDDSFLQVMQLATELDQTNDAIVAIETFGSNPAAIGVMQVSGLLCGTALEHLALESLSYDSPTGNETQIALEALGEKATEWAAKIVSAAKTTANAIFNTLKPLYEKIKDLVAKGSEALKNKTVKAAKVVTAHPVKTLVIVIGAIVAVAGIMVYSASNLPGAAQSRQAWDTFSKKVSEMTNAVKWPWGAPKAEWSEDGMIKWTEAVTAGRAEDIPVEKLGWNYHAARAIGSQVDAAWTKTKQGLSEMGPAIYSTVVRYGRKANDAFDAAGAKVVDAVGDMTGSRTDARTAAFTVGGIKFSIIASLIWGLWKLTKKIITAGFRLIISSLKSLVS